MSTEKQVETLPDYWGKHIQNWQQTDQSQNAYCKEHDLNYHRFTYWRRKLASKDQPSALRSGFVPVKPCPSITPSGLTATLPNGVLLQGITDSNLSVVKQLLGLHP